MTLLADILNKDPISRARRNHALEHATLSILSKTDSNLKLAGYSDHKGFWIFGDISLEALQQAVEEGLARLRDGENELAIHANCGTNYAVSGILAGSAAWLAMLGSGRNLRQKLERWPLVISLVTLALVVARPLGPLLQKRVTTQASPGDLQVVEIIHYKRRKLPMYRIRTQN